MFLDNISEVFGNETTPAMDTSPLSVDNDEIEKKMKQNNDEALRQLLFEPVDGEVETDSVEQHDVVH